MKNRKSKPDALSAQELLHGAYLTIELFANVMKSGHNKSKLFRKYPGLQDYAIAAEEALSEFYLNCGSMLSEEYK